MNIGHLSLLQEVMTDMKFTDSLDVISKSTFFGTRAPQWVNTVEK